MPLLEIISKFFQLIKLLSRSLNRGHSIYYRAYIKTNIGAMGLSSHSLVSLSGMSKTPMTS